MCVCACMSVCIHVCACVQVSVCVCLYLHCLACVRLRLVSCVVHAPAVIGSDGNKRHRFGLPGPFHSVPPHRFPGAAFSPYCFPLLSPAPEWESCVLIPSQAFPLGVSSQEKKKENNYSLFGK